MKKISLRKLKKNLRRGFTERSRQLCKNKTAGSKVLLLNLISQEVTKINAKIKKMTTIKRSQSLPCPKLSFLNLRESKSLLVKYMINLSERKSIPRMSSLKINLRGSSIRPRNKIHLSISPKITHKKVPLKIPQPRKIQEEAVMDQEVGTAKIMKDMQDIQLRMSKMKEDNSSQDKNATTDKRTVIKAMVKLILKKIRKPLLRMLSMRMKFTTRALQVALLVLMTEEPVEAASEVENPTTMMTLVIKASEVEADATTRRMMRIKTEVAKEKNPRRITRINGGNLIKIP